MLAFYRAYPAAEARVPQPVALLPDPTLVQKPDALSVDEDLLDWKREHLDHETQR